MPVLFNRPLIAIGVVLASLAIVLSLDTSAARAETICIPYAGDGDSFMVSCAEGIFSVRVLSIDTPEAYPWYNSKGVLKSAECWGRKAANARKALTDLGPVTLTGTETDGHGRLLRYVTLADGRDLGETLVAGGHAAIFKGTPVGSPDWLRYTPLQSIAQSSLAGMWGGCPLAPGHNGVIV